MKKSNSEYLLSKEEEIRGGGVLDQLYIRLHSSISVRYTDAKFIVDIRGCADNSTRTYP